MPSTTSSSNPSAESSNRSHSKKDKSSRNRPRPKPIPTPYDRFLEKHCKPKHPPVSSMRKGMGQVCWPCNKSCGQNAPPCPPHLTSKKLFKGRFGEPPMNCCDGVRQQKLCQAELQRLREERWKEQEKKALMEERRRREWLDEQYMSQVRQWEDAQKKCLQDQERRDRLLKEVQCQRKEMKRLRQEAKAWRRYQQKKKEAHKQNEEDFWVEEYCQRENERKWEQDKLKMCQEDKFLNAQMQTRDSRQMQVPELEELRRMFAPVGRGPNETFEYFLVEPRPTSAEMKKSAQLKMAALLGLRDQHGIHLNLSDRVQKRTTIQLCMGPKLVGGERNQACNVITQPGASCCRDKCSDSMPTVPVPKCLAPLMQTLSYRVNQMKSPLLRLEGSGGPGPGLEPGPNFNGARLFGTVVIPKGNMLSPYYTDACAVTF